MLAGAGILGPGHHHLGDERVLARLKIRLLFPQVAINNLTHIRLFQKCYLAL